MTPVRILLVEDEALIAADIEDQLTRLGYVVVGCCDTGADAVAQTMALQPDLVLMDIRLKGPMDGIHAAEQLRTGAQTPVVFLTAHADRNTLQRAGLSAPFGYLVKPIETRDLYATIEMALYRYQAESRLRTMERRLATTLESIGDGVLTTDLQGRITFLNPVAERLTGWRRSEALGRPLSEVFQAIHEKTRERLPDLVAEVIRQGIVISVGDHTCLLSRHEGELPIDDSAAPIRDDDGRITGVVVTFRDRSERQRLEEKLREAQKLESLGILAGGIAHDFNNLLTSILGHAELCQQSLPPDPTLQTYLQHIVTASHHAAEMCAQMLAYAGKGPFTLQLMDLSALVLDTINLVRLAVSKQARIGLQLEAHLPAVSGDPSQVQQIIMNLVMNASEALGEAPGEIRLTTGTMHASRVSLATAVLAPESPHEEYVFLEVSDTGSGMSPDLLSKIFDPFFTTKFTGRGLGLAAVLGIVRRHHGALTVDSRPGHGSTFRLFLPKAVATVPAAVSPKAAPAPWRSSGTILIVDDEALVRDVTRVMVAAFGFESVEAASGREALALLQAHGVRVQAVILDLTMPDMDGVQTLRALRQERAELPVLLISGYSEQEMAQRITADRNIAFLQKPFALAQLQEALRSLLG